MLNGVLREDEYKFDSDSSSDISLDSNNSSYSINTQSKVNFCKLLQFLGVKSKEDIINFFDIYIENAAEKRLTITRSLKFQRLNRILMLMNLLKIIQLQKI